MDDAALRRPATIQPRLGPAAVDYGYFARRYGVTARSRIARDIRIGVAMWRDRGFGPLLRHARTVGMLRLHARLIDRFAYAGLPHPFISETVVQQYDLKTSAPHEARHANVCASVPAKLLDWSLDGLPADPRDHAFVDVGSGCGAAVLRAARRPFRKVIGVELARELHEAAEANLCWARRHWPIAAGEIELRHESALAMEFPDMPCILFLYSPFEEDVMRPFIEHVLAEHRARPRPMIVLYLHAVYDRLFQRSEFAPLPLLQPQRLLLDALGPVAVRAYRVKC